MLTNTVELVFKFTLFTFSKLSKTFLNLSALLRHLLVCVRQSYFHASLCLKQLEALRTYIQNSKFLGSPEVRQFALSLVTNQLGLLTVRPGGSGTQCVLEDLTIHLAAVLLCATGGILAPLQQLARAPANMHVCTMQTAFNVASL